MTTSSVSRRPRRPRRHRSRSRAAPAPRRPAARSSTSARWSRSWSPRRARRRMSLISAQTQAVTAQISAIGTLKSALSTFQSSLGVLDTPSAFDVQTASSTDPTAFTATASSGCGGRHLQRDGRRRSHRRSSCCRKPFVGGARATVGTGTLSLTLGGTSFNVAIDATDDTLAGIAAAINGAAGNPGIAATVLTGTDGAHLVLSSSAERRRQYDPGHRDRRRQRPGGLDLRHRQRRPTTRSKRRRWMPLSASPAWATPAPAIP